MARAKKPPITPIDTFTIHTEQNGEVTVEIYGDEYQYGGRGDPRKWELRDKAIKMCVAIVEEDVANDRSINYLRKRMKFAHRCVAVLGEDTEFGIEKKESYRKKVYTETLNHLNAYFNTIESQQELERNDLAIKFHGAFKKIIEK